MTPQEITKVVEAAIEARSLIPIWIYLLMVIFPLIGAYLGSYLKKRLKIL